MAKSWLKYDNVIIFSGRIGRDKGVGKYTTIHNTTVDYVIGSGNMIQFLNFFEVLDYNPLLSDIHCALHTSFEFPSFDRQTTSETKKVKE